MSFYINLGEWNSIFAVPSRVVDKDLKLASAYQLKVLLYILRFSQVELTEEEIGQQLNMHPSDVKDSIRFWVDLGLIVSDGSTIQPKPKGDMLAEKTISHPDTDVQAGEQTVASVPAADVTPGPEQKTEAPKPRAMSRPQRPDSFFVARRLAEDGELATLMDEAQVILGKPLSSGDTATLVMLRDTDGLPVDVLIMLMQYCVSINKGNMRTVERIGISWASEGIVTLESAENKIKQIKESTNAWGKVSSVFGIKNIGSPTKKQLGYAVKWLLEWKFSSEMLREAYERCVDTKGEVNLTYIDGILKRWKADSVYSLSDVQKKDSKRKQKYKKEEANSASYDLDEYESKSIFDD